MARMASSYSSDSFTTTSQARTMERSGELLSCTSRSIDVT
jgi:hypothetical protein